MTVPAGDRARSRVGVGVPLLPGEIERQTRTPDEWVGDLDWHRSTYKWSKFQWSPLDPVLIATEFTQGQDTFTSVSDLTILNQHQLAVGEYATTCERALGTAITEAAQGLRCRPADLAEVLQMSELECDQTVYLSALNVAWSDPKSRTQDSNPQVRRIRRMCAGLFFTSPLLLAWELKQVWRLYQSAQFLLEDTIVDLIHELDHVTPIVLARAAGVNSVRALDERVQIQRTERGPAGDPRRQPLQRF